MVSSLYNRALWTTKYDCFNEIVRFLISWCNDERFVLQDVVLHVLQTSNLSAPLQTSNLYAPQNVEYFNRIGW